MRFRRSMVLHGVFAALQSQWRVGGGGLGVGLAYREHLEVSRGSHACVSRVACASAWVHRVRRGGLDVWPEGGRRQSLG